jgi:Ni/Co efflux regulator RcnB
MMTGLKTFTRALALATAASVLLAPIAQADRGRGRGGDDGGRWERRSDDDDHRRRRGRGDDDGHRSRSSWDDDDDHRRHRSWDDDEHRSRRDYGYYDRRDDHRSRSSYGSYYPRSSVTVSYGSSYGPYYSSGYRPRYDVGHYYSYGPRRTVYINDYDRHNLYEPPYGYHWVRDNDRGDAILASVATGAIIGLVIGAIAYDD